MSDKKFKLDEAQKYALSDYDIADYMCEPLHIVSYRDLARVQSIYDLLKDGYFVILYQMTKKMGHWVACIDHGDYIEFFDSLGKCPDRTPEYAAREIGIQNYQTAKLLTKLLYDSGKDVIYNNIPLQGKDSNTCGRWVIGRIIMRDVPLEKFQLIFDNPHFTPDQIISMMIRVPYASSN